MINSDQLLVISDKQLAYSYNTTSIDKIKPDNIFVVEHDCACAAPPSKTSFSYLPESTNHQISNEIFYMRPALYIDKLCEGFYFAFNPIGGAGVVAFNQIVADLLNVFQRPYTLAEGLEHVRVPLEELTKIQELVQLGMLEVTNHPSQPQITKTDTLTVWLHVTNNCNLRCSYCYVSKTPDLMEIETGQRAVEAVFRSALANNFRRVKLKYAGGEATLNFHLVLLLHQYAQKLANEYDLDLDGVVLSNGVALSQRMIEALKENNIRLMISLDGVGRYHDSQRPFVNGRGSFNQVERSLDRLAAQGLIPSISITISNRNLEGLPELVEYVLKRHLPFTLNFYRENECSAPISDLAYQDEKIIAAMKKVFTVIEANLPPYSLLGTLVDRARLDTLHDRPCGVGSSYMVINQNGGIGKCHMEMERTITDVTVSDPLKLLREDQIGLLNPSVDEKEGCKDCTWRYWCAGGCPALTYRVTGRFDIKSPNCRIYKALFPEVLRLEGLRLLKYSGLAILS